MTADGATGRGHLRDLIAVRNPVILGSGPPGRNARGLVKHGRYAGAVVGKSITFLPRRGNPHPRIVSLGEFGLINWENTESLRQAFFSLPSRPTRRNT